MYNNVRQTTSYEETSLFTLPVELELYPANGEDKVIIYEPEFCHDLFAVQYSPVVQSIAIDPDNWILNAPSQSSKADMEQLTDVYCLVYPIPATDVLNVELTGLKQGMKKVKLQNITEKIYLPQSIVKIVLF